MDQDSCKSITKLIVKLSTSGDTELNQKDVKDLIHYAGKSQEYLKFTHERLLKQLQKNHSEIRFGVFLIISEFFKELFLDDFRTILNWTLGDESHPLPEPTEAATKLKRRTFQAIHLWHTKFSQTHARLPIALNYLKHNFKSEFESALRRNEVPQNSVQQQRQRQEISDKQRRLRDLREQVNERGGDVVELLTEMKNCLNLVIPKPEEFMGDDGNENDAADGEIDLREHGFTATTKISIELVPHTKPEVVVTDDNEAIIDTLKDSYKRAKNRFLPLLDKWIKLAAGLDNSDDGNNDDLPAKVLTWKNEVVVQISRFEELDLISKTSTTQDSDFSDSDDSDDFEDVPEKEGYEEFAVAPPVIPKMSSSTTTETKPGCSTTSSALKSTQHKLEWSLGRAPDDNLFLDPTYGVTPRKILPNTNPAVPATSTSPSKTNDVSKYVDGRKRKLLSVAPKLPFDIDLYHWEDKELRAPSIEVADTGVHRFWQPIDREGETIEDPNGIAALRTRTIEFAGKFEPVEWSCRAPLPSGKLCPRKDREKCPFHGRIIPRDVDGTPTNPEDKARIQKEKEEEERNRPPDWQDPKYLKELEAQIGIDLTIRPAKRGGKTFAEKYPKLTDIRKAKDDPRQRLEKKIFNKKALKRVCKSLDKANEKRFKDKFGDQFNYTG